MAQVIRQDRRLLNLLVKEIPESGLFNVTRHSTDHHVPDIQERLHLSVTHPLKVSQVGDAINESHARVRLEVIVQEPNELSSFDDAVVLCSNLLL